MTINTNVIAGPERLPWYQLIDSGNGRKLENVGGVIMDRPAAGAIWAPGTPEEWRKAAAQFDRTDGKGWTKHGMWPSGWVVELEGIKLRVGVTDFGHVGFFPEHAVLWPWLQERSNGASVLNLFAYSGGATLAAAKVWASVCHVDASKGMVDWARKNAAENGLEGASVRWIVDDVRKFLKREIRRGVRYDGIILDPPSFGRGNQGEVFKIESDLVPMLDECRQLLSAKPRFVILTCHTPGFTPVVLETVLKQRLAGLGGSFRAGEMVIPAGKGISLPSGTFVTWSAT